MFSSWLSWGGGAGFAVLAGFCGVNIPQTASSKPQTQHQWMREWEGDGKIDSPTESARTPLVERPQEYFFVSAIAFYATSYFWRSSYLLETIMAWVVLTSAWEQTRMPGHLYDVCDYFWATKLWSKAHGRRGCCPGRPAPRLALGCVWECWFWERSHQPNW